MIIWSLIRNTVWKMITHPKNNNNIKTKYGHWLLISLFFLFCNKYKKYYFWPQQWCDSGKWEGESIYFAKLGHFLSKLVTIVQMANLFLRKRDVNLHCPNINLNLHIKTEPITVGDIRIQKLDIYRCIRSSRESVTCRLCFYAEIPIAFGTAWVLHY